MDLGTISLSVFMDCRLSDIGGVKSRSIKVPRKTNTHITILIRLHTSPDITFRMQKVKIPITLHPGKAAQHRLKYDGVVPLEKLPRLRGVIQEEVEISSMIS